MGLLAQEFRFQPSELWEMPVDDLSFWLERHKEAIERIERQKDR